MTRLSIVMYILALENCRRELKNEPNNKGGNTEIRFVVDETVMPTRVFVTEGNRADCARAINLIKEPKDKSLFPKRGKGENHSFWASTLVLYRVNLHSICNKNVT